MAANGTRRGRLLQGFKNTQNQFDKEFRKTEKKYKYDKMCDIDNLGTSDPKIFWETLENLGPCKATNIPLEVVDEEGNISTYLNNVLNKWVSEFKKLFSFEPEDGEIDDDFYSHIINGLQ